MLYGVLILALSMILAVFIRRKKCKKSCIFKKVLPYLIVLIGGLSATYVVLINRL